MRGLSAPMVRALSESRVVDKFPLPYFSCDGDDVYGASCASWSPRQELVVPHHQRLLQEQLLSWLRQLLLT